MLTRRTGAKASQAQHAQRALADGMHAGIARDLVLQCLRIMKEAGCYMANLETEVSNREATLLYTKLGFQKASMVFGRWEAALMLTCPEGQAAVAILSQRWRCVARQTRLLRAVIDKVVLADLADNGVFA